MYRKRSIPNCSGNDCLAPITTLQVWFHRQVLAPMEQGWKSEN